MSPTCSEVAEALGERTAGSASRIASWVLVEHPGPWGEDTREQVFADLLGERRWAELTELWLEQDLRPLLVRRHGRRPADEPRRVIIGSALDRGWIETLPLSDLTGIDLAAVAAGRPGQGTPRAKPLLLVCTNGAVDRCCASRGRPLAAALASAHPDLVLESTHLGGCRFAANLLSLPSGEMHGRLSPEDGLRVAADALAGFGTPTGWRGRTTDSSWAAVARDAVLDLLPSEDLRPQDVAVLEERLHADTVEGEDGPEPAGCDVVAALGDRAWTVTVRTQVLAPRTSLCDDEPPWPTPVVTHVQPH